jgi:hypothetical protein
MAFLLALHARRRQSGRAAVCAEIIFPVAKMAHNLRAVSVFQYIGKLLVSKPATRAQAFPRLQSQ